MTKLEAIKFVAKLTVYYPVYKDFKETKLKMLGESWQELTEDINIEDMLICLKRHVATNKWPPTISDIRNEYMQIKHTEPLDDGEAWKMAKKYQRRNYFGPGVKVNIDEIDNSDIPEEIQKATKSIGFEAMMLSENEDVLRSNFMNIYKIIKNRAIKEKVLPINLRTSTLKPLLNTKENNKVIKITAKKSTNPNRNVDFDKKLKLLQQAKNSIGK